MLSGNGEIAKQVIAPAPASKGVIADQTKFGVPSVGQVIKGLRWMPWDQGPKNGAARLR